MKVGRQRYEPNSLWQGLSDLLSYHLAVNNLEFGFKYDINLKESHKMWITLKIFLRGKTPLLKLSTRNLILTFLSSIHSSVFFKDRKYLGNFRCKVYMEKQSYSELVTDSRRTSWCKFQGSHSLSKWIVIMWEGNYIFVYCTPTNLWLFCDNSWRVPRGRVFLHVPLQQML